MDQGLADAGTGSGDPDVLAREVERRGVGGSEPVREEDSKKGQRGGDGHHRPAQRVKE